jgi:Gp37 protein
MGAFLDSPWGGQNFSPATPLDLASIESAIVARLQTFLASALGPQMIEVTHFPDKPEAYEMRHCIGVAMVVYSGGDYGPILDIGHVAQERTLEWEIGLRIRDLGWAYGGQPSGTSPGAYQVIEAIRMALLGFQPNTGCTPMKAIRERFIDRDRQGGVWVYSIWFSTRTVAVENFSIPTFPLFIQGTALEEGGQTGFQVQLAIQSFTGSPGSITLAQQNVQALVVKSQNLVTTYVAGTDYSVDNVNGIITRIATGAIPANATVAVSYTYADVVTTLASGGSVPSLRIIRDSSRQPRGKDRGGREMGMDITKNGGPRRC